MIKVGKNSSVNFRPPPKAAFMQIVIVDPDTGLNLPCIEAKEGAAIRLRGLGMIQKDLEKAQALISAAINYNDDELTELRWHGAIIAYGRCFVSSDGRGMKLESQHTKVLGPANFKTHNRVMELRHQYVAHSGKNNEQHAKILIPFYGDLNAPEIKLAMFTNLITFSLPISELEEFLDLLKNLSKTVEEMFTRTEQLVVDFFASKTPDQLKKLLENQTKK